MAIFEKFTTVHQVRSRCRVADPNEIEAYSAKLPQVLLDFWAEAGWCAYADGLIWFTNPADYRGVVAEWFPDSADETYVFARTAFGDLMLWRPDGVNYLFVHQGGLMQMIHIIELYINDSLTDDQYLDKVLGRPFFQTARERFGPLSYDKMYGFEPALALGGSGDIETVVKVRIYEHLSILAQVTGGV